MLLFFILLLLVPCLAIKRRADGDEAVLNARSTTCIKGVLCLFVMFHNLGLDYKGNSEVMELICEHAGGVGVGLFFFLSAFGIVRSYQKKGNQYLPKLLFVNVVKLYIVSVLINLLTYFVFFQGAFEKTDLLMRIFNLDVFNDFNRMNRHGWYISTIIAMYIIFALVYYLCSKLKTESKFVVAGVVLSVIAVGFRVWAHIADRGGMYTRELPTFAIGVMYATFYEQANKFLKKYFTPSVIICSIGFWVGFFTLEFIATYSAALFIITVSQKITYDSSVTYFLGKICLGVYLFLHFSSLALQPYVTNPYWWMLLNAGFILELSVLLYGAQTLIQKFLQGCSTKIKERQENR
jgi:peptidoglycan/LPS O-acetylase OafA/YrhL